MQSYPWPTYDLELYHHGVKGQKWGVRRYQNEDGTLTEAGKRQKRKEEHGFTTRKTSKYYRKAEKAEAKAKETKSNYDEYKAKRLREKAELSNKFDSEVGSIRKARTKGESICKYLLNGVVGQRTYDYARAYGTGPAGAFAVNSVAGAIAGPLGQCIISSTFRSGYIKSHSKY